MFKKSLLSVILAIFIVLNMTGMVFAETVETSTETSQSADESNDNTDHCISEKETPHTTDEVTSQNTLVG